MKTSLNFFLIVSCLTVATVQAEAPRPFLNLGFDLGGEKLARVIYKDGDTASIRANEGGNISLGLALPLGSGVDLQSSIGYQGINETATNGEVSWRSFPWETSIIAHLDRFQIGGGVIYHLSPKFKSGGDLSIGDHYCPVKEKGAPLKSPSPLSCGKIAVLETAIFQTGLRHETF